MLSWLSLLPPLIVILIACITQALNKALIIGIASAAFITTQGSLYETVSLIFLRTYEQITNRDNLYLYIFLITVPSIVVLLNKGNGPLAFTRAITKKIRTKTGAQMACVYSSFALCIDDYLSILTNGHIMRSLTDHFGIPRVKLAFLIHALSGPVVILSPISSWVATITAYLSQAGIDNDLTEHILINADPFYMYLHCLPYIFYSLLTIAAILFIVKKQISYGPMHAYEQQSTPMPLVHPTHGTSKGSLWDLLLPLGCLLFSIFVGILYVGDFYLLGGHNSFLEAFKNNKQIFLVLAGAGSFSLMISFAFAYKRRIIHLNEIPSIIGAGFQLMKPAIIMVFLASILSLLLRNDLMTGQYLAHVCTNTLPLALLPAMFFILSLVTSIATGSSWGTFGLMLPIAVPMLTSMLQLAPQATPDAVTLLYPVLGAIFSGALCGDHISPFSETTVMSAASTQIEPMEHVYTQLPYALPVIAGTLGAFIASGYLPTQSFWIHNGLCILIGIIICFILLFICNKNNDKQY